MNDARTIVTVQTPPGRGGIAVIELSGDGADEILRAAFAPRAAGETGAGRLQLGRIVDGGETLDEAIVCRTAGGAEISVHGGPVVVRRVLELLARLGATAAAPGTADSAFSAAHRLWNNPAVGREMLAALPLARSAVVVAALSRQWSAGLSELAACSPADASALRAAAGRIERMRRVLHPAEVVLAGPPNAGKSTLANALVGRAVSIVSDTPGTTRDWVRELALPGGLPVWLTDTAGLWDVQSPEDAEAVRRARDRAGQADLVLLVESGEPFRVPDWLDARRVLRVAAKCDLPGETSACDVRVSARTGEGMDAMREAILAALGLGGFDPSEAMAFTDRQAGLLARAADALDHTQSPAPILRQLLRG